uniref:Uncharacterized protein n=1 Tax=Acrobeloides nanus TaxID=290746 RepID=A0A914DSH0_9BILA
MKNSTFLVVLVVIICYKMAVALKKDCYEPGKCYDCGFGGQVCDETTCKCVNPDQLQNHTYCPECRADKCFDCELMAGGYCDCNTCQCAVKKEKRTHCPECYGRDKCFDCGFYPPSTCDCDTCRCIKK